MGSQSSKPAQQPKPKPVVVPPDNTGAEDAEERRKRLQSLNAGNRRVSLIDNSNVARTSLLGQ